MLMIGRSKTSIQTKGNDEKEKLRTKNKCIKLKDK